MRVNLRFVVSGFITATALLGTITCGSGKRANVPGDHPLVGLLKAGAEALRSGGGGQGLGFVCTGDADGTIVCVCDDNAPSGTVYSCDGMEKICGLLGTGSLCNPSTDWCWCGAVAR